MFTQDNIRHWLSMVGEISEKYADTEVPTSVPKLTLTTELWALVSSVSAAAAGLLQVVELFPDLRMCVSEAQVNGLHRSELFLVPAT